MRPMPLVHGVVHRFVEARGLRFHVAEAGTGDDVVVLLHGYPQHWYEWRDVMPALADRHRVLAIDLRGFGWSDAPRRGYLKEHMVDDVLAVLEALGVERVKLVGHDWGGWIGFLLCLRAPERVERYVALNILHPWPRLFGSLRHLWRFWYMFVLAAPVLGPLGQRTRWMTRLLLRGGVADPRTWTEDLLADFTEGLATPARTRAGVQLYRTFLARELVPILFGRYRTRRLTVPTSILFGVDDFAMTPAQLGGHEPFADDLRIELVSNCGHFIVDERPDVVIAHLRACFDPHDLETEPSRVR